MKHFQISVKKRIYLVDIFRNIWEAETHTCSIYNAQWNLLSNSNLLWANCCDRIRQVFGLHMLNQQGFPMLYMISAFSEFGLDKLHCTQCKDVLFLWEMKYHSDCQHIYI